MKALRWKYGFQILWVCIAMFILPKIGYGFDMNSSTYDILNYHTGTSAERGYSTTYKYRSGSTFQQGGNLLASSLTYKMRIGHLYGNRTNGTPVNTSSSGSAAGGGGGGGGDTLNVAGSIDNETNEWIFLPNDGVCQYSLGENQSNSDDCKPGFKDYAMCLFSSDKCFSREMSKNALISAIVLITITSLYIISRYEDKKKKHYASKSEKKEEKK